MVEQVSAKEMLGIDDLLEGILLVAEDLQPRANPTANPPALCWKRKWKKGAAR